MRKRHCINDLGPHIRKPKDKQNFNCVLQKETLKGLGNDSIKCSEINESEIQDLIKKTDSLSCYNKVKYPLNHKLKNHRGSVGMPELPDRILRIKPHSVSKASSIENSLIECMNENNPDRPEEHIKTGFKSNNHHANDFGKNESIKSYKNDSIYNNKKTSDKIRIIKSEYPRKQRKKGYSNSVKNEYIKEKVSSERKDITNSFVLSDYETNEDSNKLNYHRYKKNPRLDQSCKKIIEHNKMWFKNSNELPKTTLDHYEFIKPIGEGTFGKVTLGMHKLTGKYVAIKTIDKENIMDEIGRASCRERVYVRV